MLSGYFSYGSIHREKISYENIKQASGVSHALQSLLPGWTKRSFSLLFPVLFWTLADQLRIYFLNLLQGYPNPALKIILISTISSFAGNLWFLWVVWFCYTITLIMHVLFQDS